MKAGENRTGEEGETRRGRQVCNYFLARSTFLKKKKPILAGTIKRLSDIKVPIT